MKVHFLGTASSEGMPNPFCKCDICDKTRKQKGRDIRTRASVLINNDMLIDLSPEFSYQIIRDDIDITKVKDLLFTHTHPDHFNVGDLYSRMIDYAFNVSHPLHIYGNDRAINGCLEVLQGYSQERFVFHMPPPYVTFDTTSGAKVTALLSNHAKWEYCFIYVIEKDGKTILHGHDSGYYPELTWEWLKGRTLDLVIVECTYGYKQNDRTNNHMSVETVLATHQRMLNEGIIRKDTKFLTSHHSHSSNLMYADLEKIFEPYGIQVSYDGLTLEV